MRGEAVDKVEAWLTAHTPRLLDELLFFLRIPSVSTDPVYAEPIREAAGLLMRRLARIGMHDVRLLEGGGHPSVFAERADAPGTPTILIYGHYDVQPPDPLELWHSPPFEPAVRDGKIFARGATDDKSPLWIALSALEGWLTVHGRLPVNVKLLLEGEEESSSRSLPTILAEHRDLLAADVMLSADGGRFRPGRTSVNTSLRGVVAMEVRLRTAATDLHSGRYGGAVGNAAMALARLLATLHDEQNRIAVTGFCDGLQRPGNADVSSIHALALDEAGFLAEIGARAGAGEPGVPVLEAIWFRPTIEVNGITAGYQGAGGKTVIPCEASAKLTCRLGLGQNPVQAAAAVAAHLHAHCPSWADLSIDNPGDGWAAYAVPPDDPFLAAVSRVIEDVHGEAPVRVGIGGTLPVASMIKRMLGLETVMLSYAISDERAHAPNEFFRLSSFDDGLKAWARVLPELAAARREPV
jgi:acetylornithine deacetylase/succinyl-diaminopimelate desuccinylase-like protein